jgi:hypothetical protein
MDERANVPGVLTGLTISINGLQPSVPPRPPKPKRPRVHFQDLVGKLIEMTEEKTMHEGEVMTARVFGTMDVNGETYGFSGEEMTERVSKKGRTHFWVK